MRRVKQADPALLYLEGLAPTGRRSMRSLLNHAARIVEIGEGVDDATWHKLNYQDVVTIQTRLRREGKAASTINVTLTAIRSLLSVAVNVGLYDSDELHRIRSIKKIRGSAALSGQALSRSQSNRLIKACREDNTVVGVRDLAMLSLMLFAGLRRSEVTGLSVRDLDLRRRVLTIKGKGDKIRESYLQPRVVEWIKGWLHERGREDEPLFVPVYSDCVVLRRLSSATVYDVVKRRCKEAGIGSVAPHDLRRTFATRLLEQGTDLAITSKLMGHSSVSTTTRYDHRNKKHQIQAMNSLMR